MTHALLIGRFQPFHLGHLHAVLHMTKETEGRITIGVGSAQYAGTIDNPYSFEERKRMIDMVLKDILTMPYSVVAIPDIHDAQKWVTHVVSILGSPSVVYTANPNTKKLFEAEGYCVREIPLLSNVSGTRIRESIAQGDNSWKALVHERIHSLL